jgi:tetratricopeptide (TPR) repeat protein
VDSPCASGLSVILLAMHGKWLGLGLSVGLLGCGTKPATTPASVVAPVTVPVKQADPELVAIADSIDPGPQTALFMELPAKLREPIERAVAADSDHTVAVREIQSALQLWDKLGNSGTETLTQNLMRIGLGLVLAERAVSNGADDAELLLALTRVYTILDSPAFAGQGVFQQLLQMAGQLAQSVGMTPGGLDLPALSSGLERVFARAGAMHRRSAAEFLRRHGDHPEVPRVLGRLAEDASRQQQFDRALALRQMAMRRLGGRAVAGDHVDLAITCYRALELACGDDAVKRAGELRDTTDPKAARADAERIEYANKVGEYARRVRVIPADAEPTLALERGHLLLLLDRFAEAQALFERLKAAYPEDARPYGGLAKLAIQRNAGFGLASAQIKLGKRLGAKDRDFYEVALGTIGVEFLYEALPAIVGGKKFDEMVPPLLADMRSFSAGLRTYDQARSAVVDMIVGVVEAAVPSFLSGKPEAATPVLRKALAQAQAIATQFPDSVDARRMVYLATNFAATRDQALAAVRQPLTIKDDALERARVQTWLDLALAWEAEAEMPAIEAAVNALGEPEGDRGRMALQAGLLAIKFRGNGQREVGEQAAAIYTALASEGTAEARAVALNNLGLLKMYLGDPEGGVKLLVEALNLSPKAWPALMNLGGMVLMLEGAQRAELIEAFAIVARDGESSPLRLQANAWRIEQAKRGSGDVEQTRKDFAAALAKERKGEIRGATPLGSWGLISTGTVQVNFNYSVPTGFQIRNELSMTLWLVEPPPGFAALIAASDGAKTPEKPKRKAR